MSLREDIEDKHFDDVQEKDMETVNKPDVIAHDAEAKGQKITGYENYTWWQTIKTFWIASMYCTMVMFAGSADYYTIALNGGIIAQAGFIKQFATTVTKAGKPALSAKELVAIGGTPVSVGQIIGMTLTPFFCAKFGRKNGFYLLWSIILLSVILESTAKKWPTWLVAKLFSGTGVGALQFLSPTYIAEICPPRIRGALMVTYSFWGAVGLLIASVALQIMNKNDPENWHIPIFTQFGLLGLMAIFYIIIPESPFWYAQIGNEEKGKRQLHRIHKNVKGYDVDAQWEALVLTVEHERQVAQLNKSQAWTDIFKGNDLRRTIAAAWPLLACQFLGLTVFNNYSTYFYLQVGLANPFALNVITKAPQLVFVLILVPLVDKFGRRRLCCTFLSLIWVCDLAIGILGTVSKGSATGPLCVLFATLFTCAQASAAAIGYGFLGEIPSQRLRVHTAGFAASAASFMGVFNNIVVPYMISATSWNWGLKSMWFYFGTGASFAIGSWFILPEPSGRTAAELDEMFESKIKPWQFRKYKTATQLALEANQGAEGVQQL